VTLAELLQGYNINLPPLAKKVAGLCLDSRHATPGAVFIALRGAREHGIDYALAAVAAGAIAVVYEPEGANSLPDVDVPCVALPDLAQHLGAIAARYYAQPSARLSVIGVTGTDGKTSVTHFIAAALQAAGQQAAVLGTLGIGQPGQLRRATHTTPDAIRVQHALHDLLAQGQQAVAMEVSSHALHQGRVNAVDFDVAVLTNLTRDHLDYHGTVEAYAAAKQQLFHWPTLKHVVLNLDDEFGEKLAAELAEAAVQVIGYGVGAAKHYPVGSVIATHAAFTSTGIRADVSTPMGEGVLQAAVLGRFNLHNLLAALAVLLAQGFTLPVALHALQQVQTVPGRMERVMSPEVAAERLVVVDYAHTPGALEQALQALRMHTQGRLWCVFGCGGDRDTGKRALMAEVAEQLADQVIVTDDNPRTESPEAIFAAIRDGFRNSTTVRFEHSRSQAIQLAVRHAQAGDAILIAGKGHEAEQILADRIVPFDDREQAARVLQECMAR